MIDCRRDLLGTFVLFGLMCSGCAGDDAFDEGMATTTSAISSESADHSEWRAEVARLEEEAEAAGNGGAAEILRRAAQDDAVLEAVFGADEGDTDAPRVRIEAPLPHDWDACQADLLEDEESESVVIPAVPARLVPEAEHASLRARVDRYPSDVEWHVDPLTGDDELAPLIDDFVSMGCGTDDASQRSECRTHAYARANYLVEWDLESVE